MIDQAKKGTTYFRFVISPDPAGEDTGVDLNLREITQRTMQTLEEKLHKEIVWTGVVHADHAPHRHVHVLALVPARLNPEHFQFLSQEATEACRQQRRELDLLAKKEQERQLREEAEWGRGH